MLDAVRYVVDNGVKWANLPKDFPPYRRVHAFARRWQVTGLLAELHDWLRDRVRAKEGRGVDPTAAIVDSQSVRAAASVQDRHAAVPLLERLRERHFSVRLIWADSGYAGRLVEWAAEKLRLTLVIVKRSDDTSGFMVLPRWWVVERTLSWLVRSRRLVRDVEALPAMHEAMVLWSMTMLMSARLAGRRRDAFLTRPPATAP